MSKYKLAIFDLDGTLLDTSEGLLASVKYTIEKFGLEKLDDVKLSTFIGPPIQNSFQKHYDIGGNALQEIATVFRNRYSNVDLLKAVPYDGIYDLLKSLKDNYIEVAIATYKREDYAKILLGAYEFDKYADIIYGADHYNKLKKSDIINKCISDSNISTKDEIVMIGDTEHDALGAQKSNIDFVGVTYGFGFKSEEEKRRIEAIGFASIPADIIKFVL